MSFIFFIVRRRNVSPLLKILKNTNYRFIYSHGNQNTEDSNVHRYIFLLSASERSSPLASQTMAFYNQPLFHFFSSSSSSFTPHHLFKLIRILSRIIRSSNSLKSFNNIGSSIPSLKYLFM